MPVVMALVLVGCGPLTAPDPSPSSSTSTAPTPTAPPALVPEGSAQDNAPLFSAVVAEVWATDARAEGRAYVDALVAAGFDKTRMQLTPDRTTVDNPVESLQFSVAWGDAECLIGQVGPSTGEPVVAVVDQLAQGRCLVGNTRPIDW
jgi:hypothetical protein